MSPTRSEYRKLGLELVSLEENHSCAPKKPSMAEENKNFREDNSINMLLEQALTRQRDEMMENFSHILSLRSPPCKTLVGKLLGENFHRGVWNIWG
jgi:hypothetical protein